MPTTRPTMPAYMAQACPTPAPTPVTPSQERGYRAPLWYAGKYYTCTKNQPIGASGKPSKSFKVGTCYLCVVNNGIYMLVSETAKAVETRNLKSQFERANI